MISIKEFKSMEFLGDSVVALVFAEYFLPKGISRSVVNQLQSNEIMCLYSKSIGVNRPHPVDVASGGKLEKRIANRYEFTIGEIFAKNGYESTKSLLLKTFVAFVEEKVLDKDVYGVGINTD